MIGLVIVELVFTAGAVALFAFGFLLAAAFLLMIGWGANAITWVVEIRRVIPSAGRLMSLAPRQSRRVESRPFLY